MPRDVHRARPRLPANRTHPGPLQGKPRRSMTAGARNQATPSRRGTRRGALWRRRPLPRTFLDWLCIQFIACPSC
ncbi:MAG: hypothetical protein FJ276_36980 [Planctomycetes bacterium]|nr:hypothetical protein [Planctomycetota bacterium]